MDEFSSQQQRAVDELFFRRLDPVQQMIYRLLEAYDTMSQQHLSFDADSLVNEFASFLKAKQLAGLGLDEEIRTAYREFADNRLGEEEKNIASANPALLLLLAGIQNFVQRAEMRLNERYNAFLQQLSVLFLGLEVAARPALEIFQMELAPIEGVQPSYEMEPFFPFVGGQDKKSDAHLGVRAFHFQPRLKARLAEVSEPNANTSTLQLELRYSGTTNGALPQSFPPVSALLYGDDPELRYRFLWLLKTARVEVEKRDSKPGEMEGNLCFVFPVHDFGYPPELVNEPYRSAWRYLEPYPFVLDFLFELHGVHPTHFRQEKAGEWKALYTIELTERLPLPKDRLWNHLFFINAFPVFYWHASEAYTVETKIRFYEDAARLIWLAVGKEDQQLPAPIYYVAQSGEGTGWLAQNQSEWFVHMLPKRQQGTVGQKSKVGVQAVVAGYPLEKGQKLTLGKPIMKSAQRSALQINRVVACDGTPALQFQTRQTWSEMNDNRQQQRFWDMLACSTRLPHHDEFIGKLCKTYLQNRLAAFQLSEKWLDVNTEARSLLWMQTALGSKMVPCTQIVVSVNSEGAVSEKKNPSFLLSIVWRAIDRFYRCLAERMPPNVCASIILREQGSRKLVQVWRPDDASR